MADFRLFLWKICAKIRKNPTLDEGNKENNPCKMSGNVISFTKTIK